MQDASAAAHGPRQLRFVDDHLFCGEELISLTPKEKAVFAALLEANGLPLSNDALIEHAWGDQPVGPESLHRCVSTLRNKLATCHDGQTIVTHHRLGYRLAVEVRRTELASLPQAGGVSAPELFRQAAELAVPKTKLGLELALKRLELAATLDPDFLPARTMAAHAHISMALHRYAPPKQVAERTREVCDSILSSMPQCAEALASRGFVTAVIHGQEEGFEDLERAAAADPQNWFVLLYRGWALAGLGDFAGAILEMGRARNQNAAPARLSGAYAHVLHCAGQTSVGLEMLRAEELLARSSSSAQSVRAVLASWLNYHAEAIAAGWRVAEALDGSPSMAVAYPYALARAGLKEEASRALASIARDDTVQPAPTLVAPVLLEIGETERAEAALRKAEEEGCAYRHLGRYDPRLARFHR